MVVPTAPIAWLMAFTTNCMFTSLLPQTTRADPLAASKALAACSTASFVNLSAIPVTSCPLMALNNATATEPVSEGRIKCFSSALDPVKLATLSK